jgi:hypothetical protein
MSEKASRRDSARFYGMTHFCHTARVIIGQCVRNKATIAQSFGNGTTHRILNPSACLEEAAR